MPVHVVRVSPLPGWLDQQRLLGPGEWVASEGADGRCVQQAELERADAADLAARLRGVGFAGLQLKVEVSPPLPRSAVRLARSQEARRYREGSTGFTRS